MAELKELVDKLRSDNAKERRKACADLAKLGDPRAIPSLVGIYQADSNPKVKAAAAQALTRFRAMEPVDEPPPSSTLRYALYGLGGLLVLLVVANLVVMLTGGGGDDDDTQDGGGLADRSELVLQFQEGITVMDEGAAAIIVELEKVTPPDESPDCSLNIERPAALNLSPRESFAYPDVDVVVADGSIYRTNVDIFNNAYDEYRRKCRSLGLQDVLDLSAILTGVRDAVPGMRNEADTLVNAPVPTRDPARFGEPTETPEVLPTATPVPTLLPSINYQSHLDELTAIMERTRDPATGRPLATIEQHWLDAQAGQQPGSCRTPELDEPYTLQPDQQGDVNLDGAVAALNEALSVLATNYATFSTECPAGNLGPFVEEGLAQIEQANALLDEAQRRLEVIPIQPSQELEQ